MGWVFAREIWSLKEGALNAPPGIELESVVGLCNKLVNECERYLGWFW